MCIVFTLIMYAYKKNFRIHLKAFSTSFGFDRKNRSKTKLKIVFEQHLLEQKPKMRDYQISMYN